VSRIDAVRYEHQFSPVIGVNHIERAALPQHIRNTVERW
jgi:hypothetical protein